LPFNDLNPLSNSPAKDALPASAAPQLALRARTVWVARLKHWTGVDRAIAYTVAGRFCLSLAGVGTVLLIARFLTPTEQGYYYTFSSLVMLQVVFELGFSFVILQLAAHERVDLIFLPDGQIEGNLVSHSRLASLLQKAVRWYSVAGLLMALAVLPAGLYFFRAEQTAGAGVAWKLPWCLLVIAAMLNFQMDPVFSFLEGCGYVTEVAQRRLIQIILGSLLGWAALVTHHGLYAPAVVISGQVAGGLVFLFFSKLRLFLKNLMSYPVGEHYVGWRREIWPFQWKIAVSWICSYFIFGLFNPVLFAYQGPVAAGQMGMSLSIASALGAVAIAWMYTKTSPFGSLVARGEIAALDALFFRTLWQSTVLLGTGASALFLALLLAHHSYPKFAARVLPPWAFALLLLTTIMNHVIASEALYLRSHKREPFLWQSIAVAVFLGGTTLILGKFWGVRAVTVGYFVVGGLISLMSATYIFTTKRREWHGERP
jgi:hypothetical protein